ncbi:MAG: zinc metallopeptidase [Gemmataceae bacterium]|nr:zinc metallopeptidase [Gemmataceae bacterium]
MKWEGGEQSGNVEDRRGMPTRGLAVGGGAIGLIVVVVAAFLGIDPNKVNDVLNKGGGGPGPGGPAGEKRELSAEEKRQGKFSSTVLRYTEEVWEEQFRKAGKRYEAPKMVLFYDAVSTRCGDAPSAVGPFYCPADKTLYIDPTFFEELERKLGGSKAEFSQAYVIAHEVGHHVQHLLGYSDIVDSKRQKLPKAEFNQWSVRLELQADYLAGVWAHYGQRKFNFIEPGDIESALKSANAIGDDRLQKRSGSFVSPEKYTHGTSAQRVKWFRLGYETGDFSKLRQIFEMPYGDL